VFVLVVASGTSIRPMSIGHASLVFRQSTKLRDPVAAVRFIWEVSSLLVRTNPLSGRSITDSEYQGIVLVPYCLPRYDHDRTLLLFCAS